MLEAVWDLWGVAGRRPRLRMVGSSMRPLIAEGNELLIEPRPARVRLGDVALYRRDRR
ncbi:MAG: hypothetical protein GY856_43690, partial [bacterium]|nr:hypothetical protein [bacterium]